LEPNSVLYNNCGVRTITTVCSTYIPVVKGEP
jgi:hypothetical protein